MAWWAFRLPAPSRFSSIWSWLHSLPRIVCCMTDYTCENPGNVRPPVPSCPQEGLALLLGGSHGRGCVWSLGRAQGFPGVSPRQAALALRLAAPQASLSRVPATARGSADTSVGRASHIGSLLRVTLSSGVLAPRSLSPTDSLCKFYRDVPTVLNKRA